MFTFCVENREPFRSLTKNCSKLDKNKSIVSRFSVIVVYKLAVSTVQKVKATFHLTISVRGQRATGEIQRNNYHHGSCGPSLTAETMSVFLIFKQGTHRNVKNRWVRSSLNYVGCFSFRRWMFVFAHQFHDISIKPTKLHFQSWNKLEKTFSNDFALFP